MTIQDTITEDSIKDALAKMANAVGAERSPEQKQALQKTWELAQQFEGYISKWMALESLELMAKGTSQSSFVSAMSEALAVSLTKMVVLAGWTDEVALSAFASCLKDYRKGLTEQIETVKSASESSQ